MRGYEVPGWEKGARIRRSVWTKGSYVYLDQDKSRGWRSIGGQATYVGDEFVMCDDWEAYVEPPKKKTVTQYRYTTKDYDGGYSTSSWTTALCGSTYAARTIMARETRTIEVDDV